MTRRLMSICAAAAILAAALPAAALAKDERRRDVIVVLEDSVPRAESVATDHGRRFGARRGEVFETAIKGYSASVTDAGLAKLLADPRVAYVEPDGPVTAFTTQESATWGVDRIDQRLLPLSGTFSYGAMGAGVTAYVIDTGIRTTHSEFGGRATSGKDIVDNDDVADDCNGHGTHVAGTIGGSTYGVAKDVNLVAVRVLNCSGSGTISGVIAGVDWVTANHQERQPAVANMSLGGGASSALDAAVRASIADGVSYAIAAGNGNFAGIAQDACKTSPARVSEAMTVSATDRTDRKASWANYGKCVDWFAPGVGITSAWSTDDTALATISGTSMATPHTAGVAALYLQGNTAALPATVRDALFQATTRDIVTSSKTSNRHLLFTSW